MRLDIYLHHAESDAKIDQILLLAQGIAKEQENMSQALKNLEAQVAAIKEVDQAAIHLIAGLSTQLQEAKDDPAKIQELSDSLMISASTLGAAILANTTAGPEPIEPPAPVTDPAIDSTSVTDTTPGG